MLLVKETVTFVDDTLAGSSTIELEAVDSNPELSYKNNNIFIYFYKIFYWSDILSSWSISDSANRNC